jgi:Ca2+/Na+ antiporter
VLTSGLRFQSAAAWKFVGDAKPRLLKYLKYLVLGQTILVLTTSILCTVLPYVLENGHKPFYTVLLLFFATWYVLLLVFYRRAFRKWKAEQPEQKHPERKNQKDGRIIIHDLLQSNIIFCSIALLGIIPSFLLYLFGGNFEHSLWVSQLPAASRIPLTRYTDKVYDR